jgi:aldehyde dehydrogenase (NAD+)
MSQTVSPGIEQAISPRAYSGFDLQFIAGAWRRGSSQKVVKDTNPYNSETLVEIPSADRNDLDQAYESARKAQPSWAAKLPAERTEIMLKASNIVQQRREEIIQWLIHESGSTRLKAHIECDLVISDLLEAASMPHHVEGRILPGDVPEKECRVYRQPVGVVGVISPWNWPLELSARSVGPALAVGNAVVLKPASDTPVTGGSLFGKIFEEAGLPPGVLNVLVGAGSEIGDAFVLHAVPRVISFTGSTPVGRRIGRLAVEAPIIKRVELELGGNSPFVVLDDADMNQAVDAAIFGRFLHQGQICMSVNRFVIDNHVYDEFLNAFTERVRNLPCGDPEKPNTLIGPIINNRQLEHILELVHDAEKSGARKVAGGNPEGLLLPPHVFADVKNDQRIAREEIFGPVAPMIRAESAEQALEIANATEYGLSSSVFTRNFQRGLEFAKKVEAGMTHINDQPVNDLPNNPFGGEKNSGIGRFGGDWAIRAFTTDHWITVQHKPRPYPLDANQLSGLVGGG